MEHPARELRLRTSESPSGKLPPLFVGVHGAENERGIPMLGSVQELQPVGYGTFGEHWQRGPAEGSGLIAGVS